jgi:release factor glutamine methyltransferase
LLRPSGSLLVELGGDQATELAPVLRASDLRLEEVLEDEEGDARGIVARRMGGGG